VLTINVKSKQALPYICQHNWFKGPDIAMEVFAKLYAESPKYRALIVGSGRMTEEMKRIAAMILPAGTYHFAGFCPSKETVKYYLASDIALFTSRYETWGRAINEAMLCRRVCVLNKMFPAAGGLVEHEENGFVVGDLEATSYVEAIERYFALSGEAQKTMRECARVKALEMSYENHVGELRQSIEFAATSRQSNWAQSN
jgi:glycosyltransferase involved in cell wall biosynthesis